MGETPHITIKTLSPALLGAAFIGASILLLGDQDPHALIAGDGAVHPDYDTNIHGLEFLNGETLELKLEALLDLEQKTQDLLDQMLEVAPEGSVHIERLENIVAYYQHMYMELASLQDDIANIDKLVADGASPDAIEEAKRAVREKLASITTRDGYTLSTKDWQEIISRLDGEQKFFNQGRPGSVIHLDPYTGEEAWVRLSSLIPCDDDAALDMIPPSTGRKLLDFMYMPGVGDIQVTEGYPANGKHLPNGDHGNGAGVDLVPADRNFTPQRIVAMLMGADDVGARAFYEAPEIPDSLKQELIAVLREEYGMTPREAARYVETHTLVGGNAKHIHFRVPGTPTQMLVASSD